MLVLTTFDLDEFVYDALRTGASDFLLGSMFAPSVTRRLIEVRARQEPRREQRDLGGLTGRDDELGLVRSTGPTNRGGGGP